MSLQAFQQALTDLVMSPALRARVAEDPPGCLAGYDLSELEVRRLTALARDARVRTPTFLHRAFRLSMIGNTLPRTCKALGSRGLRDLMHAWWSEGPPKTMQYFKEAQRFGDFARSRLADGSFQNDFLQEVLDTELAMIALGRSGLTREPGEKPVPVPEDLAFRVLQLHPACRAVAWHHEPGAVLAALDAGRPLDGLPPGDHCLLLAAEPGGNLLLKTFRGDPARALLAVDGERPAGVLCAALDLPGGVLAELMAAGWVV